MVRAYYGEKLGANVRKGKDRGVGLEGISKDTGCPDISPSCLICLLPQCILDYPPKQRAAVRREFLQSKRKAPGK
jgi:hypothetical protein